MKRLTLRQARERAEFTQEELAAASGVRQNTISKLETRVADPGVKLVRRIAKPLAERLDIPLGDLLERLVFGPDTQEAAR